MTDRIALGYCYYGYCGYIGRARIRLQGAWFDLYTDSDAISFGITL